jgi:hypothetical protein
MGGKMEVKYAGGIVYIYYYPSHKKNIPAAIGFWYTLKKKN